MGEEPVIAGVVKQFWEDVDWDETDCMFVDCPPGTGDVPLTVFQSMPIDGNYNCNFTTGSCFNDCGEGN